MTTNTIEQRYLQLAFAIDRHQPGYVDAYYGPAEWRLEIEAGPLRPVAELAPEVEALTGAVAGDTAMDRQRQDFLLGQLRAMQTSLALLAGESLPLQQETEALYGVSPTWTPEAVFEEAHRRLDELLPPGGSLSERMARRKQETEVKIEAGSPLLEEIVAELRRRTQARFPLPAGESFEIAFVQDEPWMAYNWYLGGYRSRIEINTSVPTNVAGLVELVAHEAYPGHHTELAIKEAKLVNGNGWLEHTIALINSPACVISEGIATRALPTLMSEAELIEWNAAELFPRAGLAGLDAGREQAIEAALLKLDSVAGNAAFLLFDQQADEAEVVAYIERYGLRTEQEARRIFNFLRYARSYVFTYDYGGRLLDALFAQKRDRDAWFGRLLREPVTPAQLRNYISAAS